MKTPLLDEVVKTPALVESFDEETNREVLAQLLGLIGPVLARFVRGAHAREIAEARESGDRFLSVKEVAGRLHCSVQSVARGWRSGRYPFMLKDGKRLVGSEEALQRWMNARTRSNKS